MTLIATLLVETVQVWPPPGRRTWQYRLTWTLLAVAWIGFLVMGGVDAGSLGLARWMGEASTTILGSTFVVGGTALASYAMGRLGLRGGLGLDVKLVTDGPFAASRNPGYVGDLILIAGYVLLADSGLAGILGVVGAVWPLLAPLAEEPWLEEQYGASDWRYRQRCPRFLGRSSIRAVSSKTA